MSTNHNSESVNGARALAGFSAPTRSWFTGAFPAPTPAQEQAWSAINSGDHALVVAPTGSGKTLAAFLSALDQLLTTPAPAERTERCRVLYISPLKALAADVQRNLRSPLVGITRAGQSLGVPVRDVQVGVRTGDTPAAERRALGTRPPDILITTPESLFLILTSAAREGLRGIQQVIVDEVHALAPNKRGAHLALSLERLDALLPAPAQRIGLSATVRPPQEVGRFLVGASGLNSARGIQVVQPPSNKQLQIDIVVPVPDLSDIAGGTPLPQAADGQPGGTAGPAPSADLHQAGPAQDQDPDLKQDLDLEQDLDLDLSGPAAGALPGARPAGGSIWPHVTERVVDLITAHRATIVFTNSRRSAERLTARINEVHAQRQGLSAPDPGAQAPAEIAGQSGAADALPAEAIIARAHHGSMSRTERTSIEGALKSGRLPAVVATSSLELGIDMGAVDLVVQVRAPPSVASTLQRIGRAGHQVGAASRGVVLPTHRGDLLAAAGTAVRARAGQIEAVTVPTNPLDVLAQQVVAATAMEPWDAADLLALVRRAAPFTGLGEGSWYAVLDMLSGRYPSEDFAELRPRVVWDRVASTLTARPGALRLAATSGGTIPDRGLFGVYVVGTDTSRRGGKRVGELDEEMVFESRAGDTFTLGSSTWRIEEITADRVLVSPAPGLPGRLPFWKGDSPGRPAELGAAMGAMLREVAASGFDARALTGWGLDEWAGQNLLDYLREQEEATGRISTDATVVVERFRDELGDWRVAIHSPYGAQVHAPWALVISARLRERYGMDAQVMHSDDGIVLRLPDTDTWGVLSSGHDDGPRGGQVDLTSILLEPDRVRTEVVQALSGSAQFAARFREAAARSLLLPRRRPDRRQPLWQQRQRSAQLLSVAAQFDDFPVVLEAVRECLQDDFDVPALIELMQAVHRREVQVVEVDTPRPSPFAQSLLFGYVAQFLYDGDAPLAERRAAALTLDARLLGELLGEGAEVAELLDPESIASVEAEVGLRRETDRARDAEALVDLVRRLGPISTEELASRSTAPGAVSAWLGELAGTRRVVQIRLAGSEQWIVAEDAGRVRDALGVALPTGLPEDFTAQVPTALTDLIRRHARTHGPFRVTQVAERFGLGGPALAPVLADLVSAGVISAGDLRPAQAQDAASSSMAGPDYCDNDVLRRIRRRSLAALRAEVEPVPQATLGVFTPRWHQFGRLRGTDGVLAVVDQLAGTPISASAWESLVLPSRVSDYRPEMLDELSAAGEVLWAGAGSGPGTDGLIALLPADSASDLAPQPAGDMSTETPAALLAALDGGGGLFFRDLIGRLQTQLDQAPEAGAVTEALWELAWQGWITNDSLAPLRARLAASPRPGTPAHRQRLRGRSLRMSALRARETAMTTPPSAAGRWSVLPQRAEATRRATAAALAVLDRDGLLTRGSVDARLAGGFSTAYRVLAKAEESGKVRRGYFVEGLGAAQFAMPESVDLLRRDARERDSPEALLLAATDPACPYGLALAWPERVAATTSGHRPGRKVGASVVLVGGAVVLYLERGAKSLLSFTVDQDLLARACTELARVAHTGALGRFTVARTDGGPALSTRTPLVAALTEAGFIATPRGLRLRHNPGSARS